MKTFFDKHAVNYKYSQNGEEGIVAECFQRMRRQFPIMCEFGAHNGKYCSNTRHFVDVWAGSCLMIEADYDLYSQLKSGSSGVKIVALKDSVNSDNINTFLSVLPDDFDLLSIDTDGDNDYDVFYALYAKPKIVIIEINSGLHPATNGIKTGYKEMVKLGIAKGYFLLCHTGNLVFVDNKYRELFPEIEGDGLTNSEIYFNTSWLRQ